MALSDTALSSDEAFGLLGDETRVAILKTVWESSESPVSFTAIRRRVGNPDSGQFNYHFRKLVGHFLAAGDDGYELTQAGREVVRAVLAGVITDRPRTEPERIGAHCVDCGGDLRVRYDEYGVVDCGDCGETVMWNEFPPAGLDGRTPAEIATTFDRWTQSRFRLAMDGICPNCASETSQTIDSRRQDGDGDGDVATTHRCTHCEYRARVPLFGHVVHHPAVVSFYYDRNVNVVELPYWELRSLARTFSERVVSTDPWRAEIELASEGDELLLTLDEQLSVVDVELTER